MREKLLLDLALPPSSPSMSQQTKVFDTYERDSASLQKNQNMALRSSILAQGQKNAQKR
jgi:hypothetical protein